MDGIVEVAIASACADVQVYRWNVLLRVKKSMGIRQLPTTSTTFDEPFRMNGALCFSSHSASDPAIPASPSLKRCGGSILR
jgi:hypothetical protein